MGKSSKTDIWGGLIWFFLGIALCLGSIKLKLGNLHNPGAGLMPFGAGALLGLLGLVLIFRTALKTGGGQGVTTEKFWAKENWIKFLITLVAMFGYVLFFKSLGFLLATFLFLLLLFKLTETKRWVRPMVFSAVIGVLGYLLFCVWLKGQFPRGILESLLEII
jgi:putative tricarboxylic transport membrane protein